MVSKMKTSKIIVALTLMICAIPFIMVPEASAAPGIIDPSDTAWVMVCTALVFIMTPGVALFYGGMLRKQSMTSILAQTLMATSVMTVSWFVVGYSLAFSGDGTIIGNLDQILLQGITYTDVSGSLPTLEFMLFQCAFSVITAGIVLGACAERIRFKAITLFLIVWSVLVYAPMAHWVWGGGLFDQYLTVLDFAGGTVVHICAASTGLALAFFLGRRSKRIITDRAHSIPMVFIGFLLLWFGWLGFNGGSGLASDGIAVNAMVCTQIAMAMAMASWAIIQYIHTGRVGVLGMIAGGVAGLVAITPGAGYVNPTYAMIIGLIGGAICYGGVIFMRKKSGMDDALDVFGVHGLGGIWGGIATGIFAIPEMSGGKAGLIFGSTDLFVGQIVASFATLAFCFAMSYAIIWIISKVTQVRMEEDEEVIGADIAEHGEPSYVI